MNQRDSTISAPELTVGSTLRHPALLWSSFFGVGFLPKAPGTWGSIAAVLVWWFGLVHLSILVACTLVIVYALISIWAADKVGKDFQVKDAGAIVADEVAGMWLALLFVPATWWLVLIAFFLFRCLDIVKPWPIGWLDRELPGGWGVMADDLVAGLLTGIVVLVISFAV